MVIKWLITLLGFLMAVFSRPIFAANWLMLQGVEPPHVTHRIFAFIQPAYTYDTGDDLSGLIGGVSGLNGQRIAKNTVAPWFDSDQKFHLRRARFGMRGRFTGAFQNRFTSKMNYFVLFEAAPNGMTYDPFGERARILSADHLSLTFNHIRGARVRAGLFKTPGPEESFQGILSLDYIEFTDFISREMLERFASGNLNCPGCTAGNVGTPTKTAYGFNAVRDWGVQVFEQFKMPKWSVSYAAMLGRGEGIHETSDTDDNNELYLYGAAEYDLPGGKGPNKHGVKYYLWRQQGKRRFSSDSSKQEFNRIRQGVGVRALGNLPGGKYKHRLGLELMQAEGMIFIAPLASVAGGQLMYATDSNNKVRAFTLDYGFYLNSHWQFDARWHRNELLYNQASSIGVHSERQINETTLGVNYYYTPKQRITFNYVFREAKAPNQQPNAGLANNVPIIVNSVGDRVLMQYTWVY